MAILLKPNRCGCICQEQVLDTGATEQAVKSQAVPNRETGDHSRLKTLLGVGVLCGYPAIALAYASYVVSVRGSITTEMAQKGVGFYILLFGALYVVAGWTKSIGGTPRAKGKGRKHDIFAFVYTYNPRLYGLISGAQFSFFGVLIIGLGIMVAYPEQAKGLLDLLPRGW